MKYLSFVLMLQMLLVPGIRAWSQHAVWNYRNGQVSYALSPWASDSLESLNPKKDSNITVAQTLQLDAISVLKLNGALSHGGLQANTNGENAGIRIYLYDSTKSNGRGNQLYMCYNDSANNNTYVEKGVVTNSNPLVNGNWATPDIKKSVMGAFVRSYISGRLSGKTTLDHFRMPVIVSTLVYGGSIGFNGTIRSLRLPGIGTISPFDIFYRPAKSVKSALAVFTNPNSYPNYLMVAAHRGYFRDVADNSLSALRLAIGLNVPMVEIDIQLTKDSTWVLSHDAVIGETGRTRLPQRLIDKYGKTAIPISDLTLQELRPDLYSESCVLDTIANSGPCEPAWLTQQDGGTDQQPIPTLTEAFTLCREKVLLNMDKMDKGHTRQTAPYHLVWNAVKAGGVQGKVIVKGKNWLNPSEMIGTFPDVDWKQMMYTPTFFPEMPGITSGTIDTWTGNSNFACPGFEMIYQQAGDPLYNLIPYVKSKNKQVIQFPMWPEYCGHIITDARIDYRNSWNWLLDTPARRPTLIISDRLEVLLQLLQANNLQTGW